MRSVLRDSVACLLVFALPAAARAQDAATVERAAERAGERASEIARIHDRRISEASGIVASRKFPGVFWTHNDGNDDRLFAIARDGRVIGCAKIDANFHDWEDIAIDAKGDLYLADTGNNAGSRKHVAIFRLAEPDPRGWGEKRTPKLAIAQSWKIRFRGEPFDCESFFVRDDFGYLIAKSPPGVPAAVYRIDLRAREPELERVMTLPIDQPVTAADLSADGKELAVLTHRAVWIFPINGDVKRAAEVPPTRIAVPPGKVEGCTFSNDEILIVAESGEIFAAPHRTRNPATAPATAPATTPATIPATNGATTQP